MGRQRANFRIQKPQVVRCPQLLAQLKACWNRFTASRTSSLQHNGAPSHTCSYRGRRHYERQVNAWGHSHTCAQKRTPAQSLRRQVQSRYQAS